LREIIKNVSGSGDDQELTVLSGGSQLCAKTLHLLQGRGAVLFPMNQQNRRLDMFHKV